MRQKYLITLLFLFALVWIQVPSVHAGVKLDLTEKKAVIPYTSLGFTEVKVKAPGKELKGDKASEKAIKRGNKLKSKLFSKMSKDAKKYFKADAVINITYWPELTSFKFPHKYVYARGEMIRYNRFPLIPAVSSSETNSSASNTGA